MTLVFSISLIWSAAVICAAVITIVYAWFDNELCGHLTHGWWHIVIPYVVWFVIVGISVTTFALYHAGLL